MQTKPKFYNKDSSLTRYSLACGYMEQTENNLMNVELWQDGNCYHVRKYDRVGQVRLFWESFETDTPGNLKKARALFRKHGGKYNKIAHCQHEMAQARLEWLNKNA